MIPGRVVGMCTRARLCRMTVVDGEGDRAEEVRWPRLRRMCELHGHPGGLARLLKDGGWVFTPAFLDSAERAMIGVETFEEHGDARRLLEQRLLHVANQSKPRKCLDALVEFVVASWLAERSILVDRGEPVHGVIDLHTHLAGGVLGVEVKSDYDAFESEIMGGTLDGDPDALGPALRARFGDEVRCQFRWLGERPTREAWGPIREPVRAAIMGALAGAPELPADRELTFKASLRSAIGRCRGAEVVVSRGPLVHVNISFAGDGWQEVADRIIEHAGAKAQKADAPFLLLYVSQPPQVATIDGARLANARKHFAAQPGLLPPTLQGVVHLALASGNTRMTATGFPTHITPAAWMEIARVLELRSLA